jgi:hypothetical protein
MKILKLLLGGLHVRHRTGEEHEALAGGQDGGSREQRRCRVSNWCQRRQETVWGPRRLTCL